MSVTSISAGSVLGRSFSVTFGNSGIFILVNALLSLPAILWSYSISSSINDLSDFVGLEEKLFKTAALGLLLSFLSSAIITYGVFRSLRGESTSLAACFEKGISRFLPSIGVVLLIALIVGAAIIPVVILGAILPPLAIIGGIVLVVIGLPFFISIYVAIPVVVTENLGPLEGIKRSRALTDGYKGTIFWALFLFGVITGIFNKIEETIFLSKITPENLTEAKIATFISGFKNYVIVSSITNIFIGTLGAVMTAVIYHDLRSVKDGLDDNQLTSLFD